MLAVRWAACQGALSGALSGRFQDRTERGKAAEFRKISRRLPQEKNRRLGHRTDRSAGSANEPGVQLQRSPQAPLRSLKHWRKSLAGFTAIIRKPPRNNYHDTRCLARLWSIPVKKSCAPPPACSSSAATTPPR